MERGGFIAASARSVRNDWRIARGCGCLIREQSSASPKLHDMPSVVFGKATFDPHTRRIDGVKSIDLVVRDGQWALLPVQQTVAAKQ